MDPVDALAARAPVAAALALAALATRLPPGSLPEVPRDHCRWRDAALAVLANAAVWMAFTVSAYGYNIDESFQAQHGRDLYDWYAGGRAAPFASDIAVMNHYGGFFELPAEAAARWLPFDATLTRHAVTALFALAGVAGAYGLAATLHSRAAGFLAVVFLLATPRFLGHAFVNPKDVPFASCMLLALLATARALPRLPRLPLRHVLACGAAIGAAMGVRIGGVLALGLFGLGLAGWLATRAPGERLRAASLAGLAGSGLAVGAVAWLVMLAAWPWAQADPLLRPFQAIAYFRDIVATQQIDFPVFYDGRLYRLSQIPRSYTLVWLAISLPEFVLAAPLAWPALRAAWRRGLARPGARGLALALVVALVAIALASTADPGVIQYDGVRHFLFVLPPLAVLLAVGVAAGVARLGPRGRAAAVVWTASLWLLTVWDMGRLFPYEYTYFNRSVAGGQARAARSYETDYLGLGYREAVRWVVANVAPPPDRPLRIAICKGWDASLADALAAAGAPPDRYRGVPWNRPADVAVAITRADCHRRFAGRPLAALGPAETPLVHVIALHR
ncbi:MAG: hypothetical protein ACQGVC_24765 [Myxococcota bacterium]